MRDAASFIFWLVYTFAPLAAQERKFDIMKLRIKMLNPEDVKEFVRITSDSNCDIDLQDGVYYIDAKSLLGVMAAATRRQMNLICHGEDSVLARRLQKYVVAA